MTITIKIQYKDDFRRVTLDTTPSFPALVQMVAKMFHLECFAIKYKDEDGDLCTISSDLELQEAISHMLTIIISERPVSASVSVASRNMIRFIVTDANSSPIIPPPAAATGAADATTTSASPASSRNASAPAPSPFDSIFKSNILASLLANPAMMETLLKDKLGDELGWEKVMELSKSLLAHHMQDMSINTTSSSSSSSSSSSPSPSPSSATTATSPSVNLSTSPQSSRNPGDVLNTLPVEPDHVDVIVEEPKKPEPEPESQHELPLLVVPFPEPTTPTTSTSSTSPTTPATPSTPSTPSTPTVPSIPTTPTTPSGGVAIPVITPDVRPAPKTYNARFVRDVTIQENTRMQTGERFVKTWRMRNDGTSAWPIGTHLKWVGGQNMMVDQSTSVEVPCANANEEVDISVALRAPTVPGRFVSYFRLSTPEDAQFGHRVWCDISAVPAEPTAPVTPIITTPVQQPPPAVVAVTPPVVPEVSIPSEYMEKVTHLREMGFDDSVSVAILVKNRGNLEQTLNELTSSM